MQVYGGGYGQVRLARELSQKAGDHTREDIARAAGAHRRRARGIDPDAPIGKGDQAALTFQDHHDLSLGGQAAGGSHAVRADFGGGLARETGHLAGMRREYAHSAVARPRSEEHTS